MYYIFVCLFGCFLFVCSFTDIHVGTEQMKGKMRKEREERKARLRLSKRKNCTTVESEGYEDGRLPQDPTALAGTFPSMEYGWSSLELDHSMASPEK